MLLLMGMHLKDLMISVVNELLSIMFLPSFSCSSIL